jgi:hypothetical protein
VERGCVVRLMSFALTEPQYIDGSKTVTRRLGWWDHKNDRPRLEAGEYFMGVRKAMGLRKGERVVKLGEALCVGCRRERLDTITQDDVDREGFPGRTVEWFIAMFCKANKCQRDAVVTRIEFRKVMR